MNFEHVRFDSPLSLYEARSRALLDALRAGDDDAIDFVHKRHPRFLDET